MRHDIDLTGSIDAVNTAIRTFDFEAFCLKINRAVSPFIQERLPESLVVKAIHDEIGNMYLEMMQTFSAVPAETVEKEVFFFYKVPNAPRDLLLIGLSHYVWPSFASFLLKKVKYRDIMVSRTISFSHRVLFPEVPYVEGMGRRAYYQNIYTSDQRESSGGPYTDSSNRPCYQPFPIKDC